MKKLFAVLTVLVLLCACLPLGAVSVSAATSGTTGDCTWTLDGTHLTISGNGAMENYGEKFVNGGWRTTAPWGGWNITSVTIENGVTTIGDYAFSLCSSLTSVTMDDSVTTIGEGAFSGCDSLTTVTIPNSVTTIGDYAFHFCTSLTSVTIGDSVTTIGDGAFAFCTSLTDVYYTGDETAHAAMRIGTANDELDTATWHYNPVVEQPSTDPDTEDKDQAGQDQDEDNQDKDEDNNPLVIIGIVIAVLLAVIVVLLFFMLNKKKSA